MDTHFLPMARMEQREPSVSKGSKVTTGADPRNVCSAS
ncbi:hypothetical protein SAMN05444390_1011070 [Marinobacterium lutimaris]|uniref:Uncharacterized protein n=1 Tax=Marinobacterium lutimaris TaxID=568106 RepID=A0A1H5WKV8_9GAMM|nr:hypothetical protein SAMN05444390_1011070 [Marinobacterium lutimaris]